jgi:hypothetical protein
MRIRTIKPEFWTSEKMAQLPDFTKLLAIGLLNHADDHGYFWANPMLIRGAIFPFDEDSSKVRRSLAQLQINGYISLAKTPDGRDFGQVVNFSKHQRVDRPRDSLIAPMLANSRPLAAFDEASTNDRRMIDEASSLEGKGREGKGKDIPPADKPQKAADPRHHEITSQWGERFRNVFGSDYTMGGQDLSALKRFLTTCKDPSDDILNTAAAAWGRIRTDRFAKACKNAATIRGLCGAYNEIRVELSANGGGSLDLLDAETFNRTRT